MNHMKLCLDAVIFDFDGTLAKLNIDFPRMQKSLIELIERHGIVTHDMAHLFSLEMIEAGRIQIVENYPEREPSYLKEAHALIAELEMEGARNGVLMEGTREMLQELKKRNIKTGIVTRNCQSAITHVFPDLFTYFDAVVTRENTPHVKPHPEHLRLALKKINAGAESASMIGDHPMDIKIGQDVGTITIGVLTGASDIHSLIQAKADIILEKAVDLLNVI